MILYECQIHYEYFSYVQEDGLSESIYCFNLRDARKVISNHKIGCRLEEEIETYGWGICKIETADYPPPKDLLIRALNSGGWIETSKTIAEGEVRKEDS